MIQLEKLDPILSPKKPCLLTIGNFDGVHLGHQWLLKKMKEQADSGTLALLTFSNHPSYILKHLQPVPMILPNTLKLQFLEELGVDLVYSLTFSQELASLDYETFLKKVKEVYPFDHLVLGEGAALGHKREGTSIRITRLADEMGFTATYISKKSEGETEISSGKIRKLIQKGALKEAKKLLGRPFQIQARKDKGEWHVPFSQCLPPDGTYPVKIGDTPCDLHIKNRVLSFTYEPKSSEMTIFFE